MCGRPSELQASLAGAFGERFDATVELVAAAIEDAALDTGGLGALGEQLPRPLRLRGGGQLAQLRLGPVDRGQGAAGGVVDELGEDATVGPVDREARSHGAADDAGAHPAAAAQTALALGHDRHRYALFPTLRMTCSSR